MKVFSEIPKDLPITPLLDSINIPEDIKKLNKNQLTALADELREFLLYTVGKSGGHLGAGLGVVELTVALHYIFDTPKDKLYGMLDIKLILIKLLLEEKIKFEL